MKCARWARRPSASGRLRPTCRATFHCQPTLPTWNTPVLYLPVLQLLAYHRALHNGQNPDQPQNLSAVISLEDIFSRLNSKRTMKMSDISLFPRPQSIKRSEGNFRLECRHCDLRAGQKSRRDAGKLSAAGNGFHPPCRICRRHNR